MIVIVLFIFIKHLNRRKKQTNIFSFFCSFLFIFHSRPFKALAVVFDQASKLTERGVHHGLKPLTQQTTTESAASKTAVQHSERVFGPKWEQMSPPLNSHMRKTSRTDWILFHIVTRQMATFWYFGRGYFSCYYYILNWRLALLAVWPSHAVLRAFLSPAADDLQRGFSSQRFSARLISEKILMISGPMEKCRLGVEGEGAIIKTPRVKGNPAVRFFI